MDNDADSRALQRENIEALGLTGVTKIWRRDATDLGPSGAGAGGPFDLVFLDPPYRKNHDRAGAEKLAARAAGYRRTHCWWRKPPRAETFATSDYGDTRFGF